MSDSNINGPVVGFVVTRGDVTAIVAVLILLLLTVPAVADWPQAGGWGHVSAASPMVVGESLYLPTTIGTFTWSAGSAGKTWTLASLTHDDGKLYARAPLRAWRCQQGLFSGE